MKSPDRRFNRSPDAVQAMFRQLNACRKVAQLKAMFIGDEDGLCLAWAGDDATCEEVAATVAPIVRRMENYEGTVDTAGCMLNVRVRRFEVAGTKLFIGAVGGGGEARAVQIHRSISGVSRILHAHT